MTDEDLDVRLRAAEEKARKRYKSEEPKRAKGLEAMSRKNYEDVVKGWEKDLPPNERAHQKNVNARRAESDDRKREWN